MLEMLDELQPTGEGVVEFPIESAQHLCYPYSSILGPLVGKSGVLEDLETSAGDKVDHLLLDGGRVEELADVELDQVVEQGDGPQALLLPLPGEVVVLALLFSFRLPAGHRVALNLKRKSCDKREQALKYNQLLGRPRSDQSAG